MAHRAGSVASQVPINPVSWASLRTSSRCRVRSGPSFGEAALLVLLLAAAGARIVAADLLHADRLVACVMVMMAVSVVVIVTMIVPAPAAVVRIMTMRMGRLGLGRLIVCHLAMPRLGSFRSPPAATSVGCLELVA